MSYESQIKKRQYYTCRCGERMFERTPTARCVKCKAWYAGQRIAGVSHKARIERWDLLSLERQGYDTSQIRTRVNKALEDL